jgi:NADPH:quinone reductase-like Zn-dependent oxidoreductase
MKAAICQRYGPPEVVRIEDVEKPAPKDNEVLVRVRATTVCAADWKLRKARPFFIRFFIGIRRPTKVRIMGMEFAGTVESVGKGVTRFRAGDEVFGGFAIFFGDAVWCRTARSSNVDRRFRLHAGCGRHRKLPACARACSVDPATALRAE